MTDIPTPGTATAPPSLPAEARAAWQELDDRASRTAEVLDPKALDRLPAPVARLVAHSVPSGAALPRAARLVMHGEIKIGRWLPFVARQILTPEGFVWAATAGRFPLRVTGYDRFGGQSGEMRWRLFGRIPFMAAGGPDISRSAAGRHAGETLLLPGAALAEQVSWRPVDDRHAVATVTSGPFSHDVTTTIDEHGALTAMCLQRWGNPDKGPFGEHAFGVDLGDEGVFDGYRIPTRWRAGWFFGTQRWADGEFFRATVEHATFR